MHLRNQGAPRAYPVEDRAIMTPGSTAYQDRQTSTETLPLGLACMQTESRTGKTWFCLRWPMRVIRTLAAVIVQVVDPGRPVLGGCKELVWLRRMHGNAHDVL